MQYVCFIYYAIKHILIFQYYKLNTYKGRLKIFEIIIFMI